MPQRDGEMGDFPEPPHSPLEENPGVEPGSSNFKFVVTHFY